MHVHERNTTPTNRSNLIARKLFRNQFQARGPWDDPMGANHKIFLDIWLTLFLKSKGSKSIPKRKIKNQDLHKFLGCFTWNALVVLFSPGFWKETENFDKISLKSRVPGLCLRDRGHTAKTKGQYCSMGSKHTNTTLNDWLYHPKHSEEDKIYNHRRHVSLILIWQEKQDYGSQ